jgi:geranylgeranyl pyrophosphate synthase
VMEETGARASIETAIAELKESAIKGLAAAPIPNAESVQALRSLADRATDRTD